MAAFHQRGGVLRLGGRKGESEMAVLVADAAWEDVDTLDLTACRLTDKSLVDVTPALEPALARSRLRELDLSDSPHLTCDGITNVAALIEHAPGLEVLVLCGCAGVDRTACIMLALLLRTTASLRTLDLSRCSRLTDAGVLELSGALRENRSLSVLRLAVCPQLSNHAARSLGDALQSNSSVQLLDLAGCTQIGERGAVELGLGLRANRALTALDLSGCYAIGDGAMGPLGEALAANATLGRLNLSGLYRLTDTGLVRLQEGVARRAAALQLELSGVEGLDDARRAALRAALEARGGSLRADDASTGYDEPAAGGDGGGGALGLGAAAAAYEEAEVGGVPLDAYAAALGGPRAPPRRVRELPRDGVLGWLAWLSPVLARSAVTVVTPRSVQEERAAVWIQAAFRGFLARKRARAESLADVRVRIDESARRSAAATIARTWRTKQRRAAVRHNWREGPLGELAWSRWSRPPPRLDVRQLLRLLAPACAWAALLCALAVGLGWAYAAETAAGAFAGVQRTFPEVTVCQLAAGWAWVPLGVGAALLVGSLALTYASARRAFRFVLLLASALLVPAAAFGLFVASATLRSLDTRALHQAECRAHLGPRLWAGCVNVSYGCAAQGTPLACACAALDLAGEGLGALPTELGALSSGLLMSVNASTNQLERVNGSALAAARGSLRALDLGHNLITDLPTELGRLSRLVSLSFAHNGLEGFPARLSARLGSLSALRTLDLSANQIASLPSELGLCSALVHLDVGSNRLSALPTELASLPRLQVLAAPDNSLSALPARLLDADGPPLKALLATANRLSALPAPSAAAGSQESLELLHVAENGLAELPESTLGALPALRVLDVRDNRLSSLPDAALTAAADLDLEIVRTDGNSLGAAAQGTLAALERRGVVVAAEESERCERDVRVDYAPPCVDEDEDGEADWPRGAFVDSADACPADPVRLSGSLCAARRR